MPLSLLQPLGVLVGIPLLEALRHTFALSYGSPLPQYNNLARSRVLITATFAMCTFAIIFALGNLNDQRDELRPSTAYRVT